MTVKQAHVLLLLSALGASVMRPATAADAAGNYAIWGPGGRSCHQYTSTQGKVDEAASFKNYLMGYLTAYDALAPDTYSAVGDLSLEKSLAWLTDYCSENKMDSFERAIGQFVTVRHEQRLRTPPGAASSGWGRALQPAAPAPIQP